MVTEGFDARGEINRVNRGVSVQLAGTEANLYVFMSNIHARFYQERELGVFYWLYHHRHRQEIQSRAQLAKSYK